MGTVETSEPQPSTAAAGKLNRALTALTNGALTFAGVGVFGGLFSLYGFSVAGVGGAEFWGWPLVAISVGAMVLVIAELASKYPFAGSMYQWPTILAGKRIGWWMGWIYAGAMFPLMTAYYASLPTLIHPLFNLAPGFHTDEVIIIVAAVIAVLWNIARIGVLGRLAQWAMILELSVVIVICLLTFILGGKHFGNLTQTATVTTTSSGAATVQVLHSLGNVLPLFIGAGIFNALWVLYTFENGGTLGEETLDAGRNAPRGVIGAYIFAVICGFIFLLCLTPSIPDMKAAMLGGIPAENAITAHLPVGVFKLFLVVVAIGLIVATNTMFTGAVRHIYGMARDGQFPFSRTFSRTLADGSPWTAVLLTGVLSLVPVFVFTSKTASIVGGATAAMYVAYFLIMSITLIYRFRGWPRVKGWFSLGRWGIVVNIVAVIGTGATALDLLWPRAATNPTYNQISATTGGNFLKDVPMAWLIIGVPLLIGVVFYIFRHKRIHAQPLATDQYDPEP
ncbi:MAG TPA: APC family permease [Streptosporangiaceae bacterium]|jgi:amino acid transporter